MTSSAGATPIILCADDFGLAPGVSRAICDLAEAGRLSATSCMSVSPFLQEHVEWLRPYAHKIDVGLHLTLTDLEPLGELPKLAPRGRLPELGSLMARAYTGRLPRVEVEAELTRQFERFTEVWGRPPDFLDGHHHVHQLPIVRQVVLDLARRRLPEKGYVRSCVEPLPRLFSRREAILKAMIISVLGRPLKRHLKRSGIRTNTGFGGAYQVTDSTGYGPKFTRFVEGVTPYFLVMCHPGFVDDDLVELDSMTRPREQEYDFFSGDLFPTILADRNIRLTRFSAAE